MSLGPIPTLPLASPRVAHRGPKQAGSTWDPFPAQRIPRPHPWPPTTARLGRSLLPGHVSSFRAPARRLRRTLDAPPPHTLPTDMRGSVPPRSQTSVTLDGTRRSAAGRTSRRTTWGTRPGEPVNVARAPPRATPPIRSPRLGPAAPSRHASHSFFFFLLLFNYFLSINLPRFPSW